MALNVAKLMDKVDSFLTCFGCISEGLFVAEEDLGMQYRCCIVRVKPNMIMAKIQKVTQKE